MVVTQKRVGLFGGAFDPIHVGHQHVAQTLIMRNILDEVWFVPVFQHPWAKKLGKTSITPYQHRVAMITLTLADSYQRHPELQSKLRLVEFKDVSYAYDTLTFFAQKHPDTQFSWIMGSEYLGRFGEFLSLHPRLIEYPFHIYPRSGFPLEPLASNMTALRDVEEVRVSSTEVRSRVKMQVDIQNQVVGSVAQYIDANHLYTD